MMLCEVRFVETTTTSTSAGSNFTIILLIQGRTIQQSLEFFLIILWTDFYRITLVPAFQPGSHQSILPKMHLVDILNNLQVPVHRGGGTDADRGDGGES